jgi:two-component system, OmpR family, phosphate regulon sensor histidine kinase PhoR
MFAKKLFWQIYFACLLASLTALAIGAWYKADIQQEKFIFGVVADLSARAKRVAISTRHLFFKSNNNLSKVSCLVLVQNESAIITLVKPSGKVFCDSKEDPARLGNYSNKPEIQEAYLGKIGFSFRKEKLQNEAQLFVSAPVFEADKVIGVARLAIPGGYIELAQEEAVKGFLYSGLLVFVVSGAIAFLVSKRINRPLMDIQNTAAQFANELLKNKFARTDSIEIDQVAGTLNKMARQLNDQINVITAEKNEKEAILSSMSEGVIAVNTREQIIGMNKEATRIFGVRIEDCRGKFLHESIRNAPLQEFTAKALKSSIAIDGDFTLNYGTELHVSALGTILRDAKENPIGALVVLNDVTRLRRLENTRKDFVANVSHELKTPITSIKGFVETLREGAIDDPKNAHRFLDIIAKQTDHLNAIVEDLLALSRIEQYSNQTQIALEITHIYDLLKNSADQCFTELGNQSVPINLVCDPDLKIKVNLHLLEQAVVNLLQNALKYGKTEKGIEVRGGVRNNETFICVQDWGQGIPSEYHERLFERFYTVDKSRNRDSGGTGLGLAIVKHIAQVHDGRVTVESAPNKGSSFYIFLPNQ